MVGIILCNLCILWPSSSTTVTCNDMASDFPVFCLKHKHKSTQFSGQSTSCGVTEEHHSTVGAIIYPNDADKTV